MGPNTRADQYTSLNGRSDGLVQYEGRLDRARRVAIQVNRRPDCLAFCSFLLNGYTLRMSDS